MTIVGDSNRDTCANGRERFLAEARVLAKIDNVDGIVHVRDFFEERSTAYFVMEYVEGSTLRQMVEGAGGRLAFSRVRDILLPVMGALTLVHAQGLLHRDISPDNVVMRKNGKPCLIDFGAARFAGSGTPMSVILKPGFAPEEQYSAAGKQGPWSDVYAMAATMYWCVTGTLAQESLERLSDNRLQPPSRLGVDIPAYAENALMAALAVKPENRTQSMSAFIAGLLGQTVEPAASASTPRQQQPELQWQPAQLPASQRPQCPQQEQMQPTGSPTRAQPMPERRRLPVATGNARQDGGQAWCLDKDA